MGAFKLVGNALLLWTLLALPQYLLDTNVFKPKVQPLNVDKCRTVQAGWGMEDMAHVSVAGANLALMSSDHRGWFDARASADARHASMVKHPGGMYSYNLQTGEVTAMELVGFPRPHFHPHGIGARVVAGRQTLFVVLHEAQGDGLLELVEVFEVVDAATLRHVRTVDHPLLSAGHLNDVEGIDDSTILVTNWLQNRIGSFGAMAEMTMRLPLTNVMKCTVATTWVDPDAAVECQVVLDRVVQPNSMAYDGDVVYVSYPLMTSVVAYRLHPDRGLVYVKTLRLGMAVDNLNLDPDGGLWAGGHPRPFTFLAHQTSPGWSTPAPSEAAYASADALRDAADFSWPFTTVLADDGTTIAASSVALGVGGGRALVGKVFHQGFHDCDLSGVVPSSGASNAGAPGVEQEEAQREEVQPAEEEEEEEEEEEVVEASHEEL